MHQFTVDFDHGYEAEDAERAMKATITSLGVDYEIKGQSEQ
jgi:hypothetical protein